MKRLSITLISLLTAVGLSMSTAQAATYTKKPATSKQHVVKKKYKKKTTKKVYRKVATKKVVTPRKANSEININIPADIKISETRGLVR